MLGKLCRLEKQCGHPPAHPEKLPTLRRHARCAKAGEGFYVFYITSGVPAGYVDQKQRVTPRRCPAATTAPVSRRCHPCSLGTTAQSCSAARSSHPLRWTRVAGSPAAAQPLVIVVKSEEYLAHIATMAGMASGDVRFRDWRGHL